jgi:2-methylcitrate dehydratase PrpD
VTHSLTATLLRHVRALAAEPSADAVLVAKTSMLDWLGCALAGAGEPLVRILLGETAAEGAAWQASVLGSSLRTSPARAAEVNGAASHALDYDDTNFLSTEHPIHPTAPVLPAALALAEAHDAPGDALLRAFVAGVETECRVGVALGVEHYVVGWHSTSTLGTFGAAAAGAHLLGLPEDGWANAIGLAAAQASGLKAEFGSMTKPFQVGRAAANGLAAATWTARGLTSNPAALDAPQGFVVTHHAGAATDALDDVEGVHLLTNTVFKHHASCYFTHSAIEAARLLRDREPIELPMVARVDVHVPGQHFDVCNILEPTTGLEGKFSLRGTVAMALLGDDTTDPAAFTDHRMHDAELIDVRDRIEVLAAPDLQGTQARLDVRLADGTTRSATLDVGTPATDLEAQWASIAAKFDRLAVPLIGSQQAAEVRELVRRIEEVTDVRELTARCGAGLDAAAR